MLTASPEVEPRVVGTIEAIGPVEIPQTGPISQ